MAYKISSSKYSNIKLNYKLWLTNEGGIDLINDQQWQLIIAIQSLGSLKAASCHLNISYRKAWGDIRKIEKILGFTLIEKHRGGNFGGSSELTEDGKYLIDNYIIFKENFQAAVSPVIKEFKRKLKQR